MDSDTKPNGAFVGLVIIVIILVIGGIYFWQTKIKRALDQQQRDAVAAQAINSTDVTDLENLNTETNNLDTTTGVDINTLK